MVVKRVCWWVGVISSNSAGFFSVAKTTTFSPGLCEDRMGCRMENTQHLLTSASINRCCSPSRWQPSLVFFSLFQSNKVPVVQHPHHMHPLTPLITYSNDHFSPGSPPTHLSPEIDPKTGESAARRERNVLFSWTLKTCPAAGGASLNQDHCPKRNIFK